MRNTKQQYSKCVRRQRKGVHSGEHDQILGINPTARELVLVNTIMDVRAFRKNNVDRDVLLSRPEFHDVAVMVITTPQVHQHVNNIVKLKGSSDFRTVICNGEAYINLVATPERGRIAGGLQVARQEHRVYCRRLHHFAWFAKRSRS